MAETPDIGGKRRRLSIGEFCATHRRHRAGVLLGLRNAVGDNLPDSSEASIAPQPFLLRKIRSQRRAGAVDALAFDIGVWAKMRLCKANLQGCRMTGKQRGRDAGFALQCS